MAFITKTDVKLYLDQLAGTSTYDSLLDALVARAQDQIENYLAFTFAGYTTATTLIAYGKGTPWLPLQPHQAGSVTSVKPEVPVGSTSTEIPNWQEEPDGSLYLRSWWPEQRGFYPMRYVVTANWGYGDWPESIKEVAIELVINMFKERDRGMYSDAIGVDTAGGGSAIGYAHAWTNRQKAALDLVRLKYRGKTGIA